mgnify:CR=1 FL=1
MSRTRSRYHDRQATTASPSASFPLNAVPGRAAATGHPRCRTRALGLLGDPQNGKFARPGTPSGRPAASGRLPLVRDVRRRAGRAYYHIDGVELNSFVLPSYFHARRAAGSRNDFLGRPYDGQSPAVLRHQPGRLCRFYDPRSGPIRRSGAKDDTVAHARDRRKEQGEARARLAAQAQRRGGQGQRRRDDALRWYSGILHLAAAFGLRRRRTFRDRSGYRTASCASVSPARLETIRAHACRLRHPPLVVRHRTIRSVAVGARAALDQRHAGRCAAESGARLKVEFDEFTQDATPRIPKPCSWSTSSPRSRASTRKPRRARWWCPATTTRCAAT